MMKDRSASFDHLTRRVRDCVLCDRMANSCRIFGRSSGQLHAPLMFVGEAPGRLGADDTAIPFHGDRAGSNFEKLIEQVGISRYDCFITNAVLCNPKDEKGNNSTPSRQELTNCSSFLKAQIDLVDPRIVVTLGSQALQALKLIEPHSLELATSVRSSVRWYKRLLIPLYHPGQRAMLHRSFFNQLSDYKFVSDRLKGKKNERRKPERATNADVASIVASLLRASGPISYFRLHKLFYLLEYHHFREKGCRLTSSYVVRQKDGPYFTELHVAKLKKAIPSLVVENRAGNLYLSVVAAPSLFEIGNDSSDEFGALLEQVVSRYRGRADDELKTAVYLTAPMRSLLRREKFNGANLFNAPIDFSAVKISSDHPRALKSGQPDV